MSRGRKPSVRYWASRGAYCATLKGVQYTLAVGPDDYPGPTWQEAHAAFGKLFALELNKGTDGYLVSSLLNEYGMHLGRSRSATANTFDFLAVPFVARFGNLSVSSLLPGDVQSWLDDQPTWNDSTKRYAGTVLGSALKWSLRMGFIRTNPLAGRISLPEAVVRGREARMSPALCDLLLAETRDIHFRAFLTGLRLTGCRPVELRHATAAHYTGGRITFRWNATTGYRWKNAKKTKKDRTIYLDDELRALVERLAKENPIGPLFLSKTGKAWTASLLQDKWGSLMARPLVVEHCEREGVAIGTRSAKGKPVKAAALKMYNWRHGFISDYLDATGDIWGCAKLTGTSVAMIESRYSHADVDRIHARLLDFSRRSK